MYLILAFAFILPFRVSASPQNPPANVEQYRWLYEVLFSEADRLAQPAESFKSFYVHLLDSDQNFPEPKHIEKANLKLIEKIEGTITFVNVIKKRYVYDILKKEDGTFVINVRVHLKDPVGEDLKIFREKLKAAEDIWNAGRVTTDFKYIFKFELVESEAESLYSVSVLDTTRGPYDRNWGRSWTATVIAHEVGHMMGLGDEYQTLSGQVDCLTTSLMCSSWSGSLMKHHYYFVLRRLIKSVAP